MEREVTLTDLFKLVKSVEENITKKVDNVNNNLEELTRRVDQEFIHIKEEVESLKAENNILKERIKKCEKLQKRNNLIIYGVVEEDKETTEELLETIINILKDKLNVNLIHKDFSSCFRLGKISDRSRPILVELISNFHKREIIQKRAKLRGTNIYINEDLIYEERQERKILVESLKTARSQNKEAVIKGNFIFIEGRKYTASEVENKTHSERETDYFSPPPSRQAQSEPSTPSPEPDHVESHSLEKNNIQEKRTQQVSKQPQDQEKKRKVQTPSKLNPPKRAAPYSTRSVK